MGSLWRSEDMVLVQLLTQRESAHDTVERLGDLGIIEFRDLSSHLNSFQREFAQEVKRCEELERVIRYFEEQLRQHPMKHSHLNENRSETIDSSSLEKLETTFKQKEKDLRVMLTSIEKLLIDRNKTEEWSYVLKYVEQFVSGNKVVTLPDGTQIKSDDNSIQKVGTQFEQISLIDENVKGLESGETKAPEKYISGVIARSKISQFQILCYRATRGNMILRFADIPEPILDPVNNVKVEKSAFIVFFSAEVARDKIMKIAQSIPGTNVYKFPRDSVEQMKNNFKSQLEQYDSTIKKSDGSLQDLLSDISSNIDKWKKKIIKEKATYHTMNMFDYTIQNGVIAEGWVPKKFLPQVSQCMKTADVTTGAQIESYVEEVETKETRPTYFETNKFTSGFQLLINSYGVPRYKEINPGVLTIITFPFLFAIMFGDFGHGIILFLSAFVLCAFEGPLKKIMDSNELLTMLNGGRYILLLMGMFSVYTGLLYNDMFGLMVDLFGTRYQFDSTGKGSFVGNTYEFGFDPAWYETTNKISFSNSVKMKMSIVFGVTQMLVGILLAALNKIHFKEYIRVFTESIPEFLILGCTFGYLSFMIVFKWCIDWIHLKKEAPDLLHTMTNFFLSPFGEIKPELYPGQQPVQIVLLILAMISIPWLFIPTPLIGFIKHKFFTKKLSNSLMVETHETSDKQKTSDMDPKLEEHHDDNSGELKIETAPQKKEVPAPKKKESHGHGHGHEFNLQEVVVHQLIHTIEFALGSVSNTASYLRLWALSLAHSELSEVFLGLTIKIVLTYKFENEVLQGFMDSGIPLAIAFLVWLLLTLGVLLGMETLSAFLHAVRLHWVEFQSKFYAGDGHLFNPFSFETIYQETKVSINKD